MKLSLVQCDNKGTPVEPTPILPEELTANCIAAADLYRRVGYQLPWVGFVAVVNGRGVGGGAFVGPPRDGYVEIAYYTLKDQEGLGYELLGKVRPPKIVPMLRFGTLIDRSPVAGWIETTVLLTL